MKEGNSLTYRFLVEMESDFTTGCRQSADIKFYFIKSLDLQDSYV